MVRVCVYITLLLWFITGLALASSQKGSPVYTLAEFTQLAEELSHKVNLFRDAWKIDPDAEFFGGTTRDYLYWLKGKLNQAKTKAEYRTLVKGLRRLYVIDVRSFIIGESDVDIVSKKHFELKAGFYGVKKIDSISADRFDPSTEMGQNELKQGYIPVEKIRLGKSGFNTASEFGNGVSEVYTGRLSVHFPSSAEFESTHFAMKKLNHPILLVIRFLRMVAVDYFKTYGADYPDLNILFSYIDSPTQAKIEKIVNQCLDGRELLPYLKKRNFARWMNGLLAKSYRAYTNQTAANELFKKYKILDLVGIYEAIDPVNQYLFVKVRDKDAIAGHFRNAGITPGKLFTKLTSVLRTRKLYHGTPHESNFRGILLQGFKPSEGGAAGHGLYGFSAKDKKRASEWRGAGDRVVVVTLKPDTTFVDLTVDGPAKKLFKRLGISHDEFAERFGIDLIRYKMGKVNAFVVKNAAVIEKSEGYYRKVLTFTKAFEMAGRVKTEKQALQLLQSIAITSFSQSEMATLIQGVVEALKKELLTKGSVSERELNKKVKKMIEKVFQLMDKKLFERKRVRAEDVLELYWTKLLFPEKYSPGKRFIVRNLVRQVETQGRSLHRDLAILFNPDPPKDPDKWMFIEELRELMKHKDVLIAGRAAGYILSIGEKKDIDEQVIKKVMKVLEIADASVSFSMVVNLQKHLAINRKNINALKRLLFTGETGLKHATDILIPWAKSSVLAAKALVDLLMEDRSENFTVTRQILEKIKRDPSRYVLKHSVRQEWLRALQHPDPGIVAMVAVKCMSLKIPVPPEAITPKVQKWIFKHIKELPDYSRLLMKVMEQDSGIVARVILDGNIRQLVERYELTEIVMNYSGKDKEKIIDTLIEILPSLKSYHVVQICRLLVMLGTSKEKLIPVMEGLLDLEKVGLKKDGNWVKDFTGLAELLLKIDPESKTGKEFLRLAMKNEWNMAVQEAALSLFRATGDKETIVPILENRMEAETHSRIKMQIAKALLIIDPDHAGAIDLFLAELNNTAVPKEERWNCAQFLVEAGSLNHRVISYFRSQLKAEDTMLRMHATRALLALNPHDQKLFRNLASIVMNEKRFSRGNIIHDVKKRYLGHPEILKALEVDGKNSKDGEGYLLLEMFRKSQMRKRDFSKKWIKLGEQYYRVQSHDGNTLFLENFYSGEVFAAVLCRPEIIIEKFVELVKAGVGPEAIVHYGVNFIVHKKIAGETANELLKGIKRGDTDVSVNKAESLGIMLGKLLKQGIYTPQNNLLWAGTRWQIQDVRKLRTGISFRKLEGRYRPALRLLQKRTAGQKCKVTGDVLFELEIQ